MLLVVPVTVACGGGGGGGGGASPTAPAVVDFTGNHMGMTTLESTAGGGCVAEQFGDVIGVENYTEWNINQSGSAISGTFWDDWSFSWCDFTGTINGSSFSAESTSCDDEPLEYECDSGARRVLDLTGVTWQGTWENFGSSARVTGTWEGSYDCRHPVSGDLKSVFTLRGPFSLDIMH